MGGIYFIGIIFLGIGILHLVAPGVVRGIDKFSNDMQGVKTDQGDTYDAAVAIRGVVFIILGIVVFIIASQLS